MASDIRDKIRKALILKEGIKKISYKDTEGHWHIGIGHSLKDPQTDAELTILGLDDDLEDWDGFKITDIQIDQLFEHDIDETFHRLGRSFTDEELDSLDPERFMALYNMAYQIGSVSGFPSMVQAVKDEDWELAADEMLYRNGQNKLVHSIWYKQTPKRCQENADKMRFGTIVEEQDEPGQPPPASISKQQELISDIREKLNELEKHLDK